MKVSIKLREEEEKPPLLRAKVPISVFGLPFAASVTAGDPSDLGLHLLTSFPSFPSLKLSYHPNPATNPNPSPTPNPFTLTLNSGAGRLGSPSNSPLRVSFHLSPNPNPTFFVAIKPQLGHFSLLTATAAAASSFPNPNHPKENGGGVHHPIPVAASLTRSGIEELVSGKVEVRVRTTAAIGRRVGLKVRWAVKLPAEGRGAGVFGRLPYLTMDKISIERAEEINGLEEEEGKKREAKEWSEKDLEAMKGMCFWMGREAQALKKESESIKESIETVRRKFSEVNERCGGKNWENVRNADAAGIRGSNARFAVVGKRA